MARYELIEDPSRYETLNVVRDGTVIGYTRRMETSVLTGRRHLKFKTRWLGYHVWIGGRCVTSELVPTLEAVTAILPELDARGRDDR